MYISDSRSPKLGRVSPEISYTNRYDNNFSEVHTYNTSYDHRNDIGVDTSPIIKVSSMADHEGTSRRDLWDVMNKTRNVLSERSLESLANLTEAQLNTELNRRRTEESSRYVTERNYLSQNYHQNYNSEQYGRRSPVYRTSSKGMGASAVKVQPVPDGVLGQPVEFESE